MKKRNRRIQTKTPSLQKRFNTRIRQEYIDQDYIHKLDDTKKNCKLPDGSLVTELEYMAIFMKEWNSGGVGKQKEAKKNRIHRTAKEVKNCTDRTNSRNRDQYGVAKARNLVHTVDNEALAEFVDKGVDVASNSLEDALIDYLDYTKKVNESTGESNE